MKSFAFLSVLATVAVVQASQSPLVPTGISTSCADFLDGLDSNTTLTSCIKPVIAATSQYGPTGNLTTPSTAQVSSVLSTLCSATSCSTTAIRSQLSSFYTACSSELTGSNANTDVLKLYDVLYSIIPLKNAACTQDDSGKYCLTQIGSTSSSASASGSASASAPSVSAGSKAATTISGSGSLSVDSLWQVYVGGSKKRSAATVTQNVTAALVPNTTTFRTSDLPFLFLTPDMSYSELCTSCTRAVLTAYINFESSTPYSPGLSNSLILGGQTALYNAVTSTCGTSFLNGVAQAAGGLAGGLVNSNSGAERVDIAHLVAIGTLLATVASGVTMLL